MRVVYQKVPRSDDVWRYSIAGLERSLDGVGMIGVANERSRPVELTGRVLAKLRVLGQLAPVRDGVYFTPLMGPTEHLLFPRCFFARMTVYCYDCWPQDYPRWESLFRRHRIEVAFFSARRSAEVFTARVPGLRAVWLPEATDPRVYASSKPLAERGIDVLELGRRHETFHKAVVGPLAAAGATHRYELVKGQLVFRSFDELVAGLGDTKLSIVFPSSMTHPARSGDVETVTHKYFESMASRCLLVGHCPAELHDLFGHNPVVEIDWSDPAGHIRAILDNLDSYAGLIERNFLRLGEVGTWDARVQSLVGTFREHGWTITDR